MTENIKVIKFGDIASSLGTRNLASKLREDVLLDLETRDKIFFDFSGVEVVTNSFANEYFGKLIEIVTVEKFKEKFAFTNVNDFIQRVLISSF
ncbi:STAS-like domain-containing protein [Pseudozobellia thermophila]|uniref:STAS-like domain-containing protein n=1 Tax=Pseudozobellia thermophila TaxID=192903 RepID=UPI0009354E14|nr:STAS-like domain-containing protein [Pseudozobellia thermophila]